ncbi:MAG: UDP-3-O-(3-hydroxymyristoyl)glucosamine N-acyltransferase [Rhodobiaceae bacterium]|nr:UDP-3-O-(3-hydroxymyristoyl)glucosamine N-acyltransferase [Rhodobiaceae bacterium]
MTEPVFFPMSMTPTAGEIAGWVDGTVAPGGDPERVVTGVAPLERAGSGDLTFFDNPKYRAMLETTQAGVCLASPRAASSVPEAVTVISVADPYRAYASVLIRLFPDAISNFFYDRAASDPALATIHPDARLEEDVIVEPGAVIGAGAEIGRGSRIGANAVIGADVRIGRDTLISGNVTIQAALIGDRVIVHSGTAIGQDGFGFSMGPAGHLKVPQIGRVVIQDDVEIGANCTVDRGANRDTIIGEGTKIDNLCQIAHNVVIGRHCVIVAQTGISGSATIGNFVALGGQVGVIGHVTIGDGAQIAATSNVKDDVPPGGRWGGTPAKPVRQWFREVTALRRLAEERKAPGDGDRDD